MKKFAVIVTLIALVAFGLGVFAQEKPAAPAKPAAPPPRLLGPGQGRPQADSRTGSQAAGIPEGPPSRSPGFRRPDEEDAGRDAGPAQGRQGRPRQGQRADRPDVQAAGRSGQGRLQARAGAGKDLHSRTAREDEERPGMGMAGWAAAWAWVCRWAPRWVCGPARGWAWAWAWACAPAR